MPASEIKPGEQIWDWEVIKALYMGGMELRQICDIPRFTELSLKYLQNRASREKWKDAREEARAEGTGQIAKGFILKMAEAEQDHQEWLLKTIDAERIAFDTETKKQLTGGKNQLERLKIINQLDETARRQLGLDDRKPMTEQQRNLAVLLQVQVNPPQIKGGASTVQIAYSHIPGVPQPAQPSRGELEAAKLIAEYVEDHSEDKPTPPPPGIKSISPFKVKGEPLVNETTEGEQDIVEVLTDAGYVAAEISPGTSK